MLVTLESLINDNISTNDTIDIESVEFDIVDTMMECSNIERDINTLSSGITVMESVRMEGFGDKIKETFKNFIDKIMEFFKRISNFIKLCMDKLLTILKLKHDRKPMDDKTIKLICDNIQNRVSRNEATDGLMDSDIANIQNKNIENYNEIHGVDAATDAVIIFLKKYFDVVKGLPSEEYSDCLFFDPFDSELSKVSLNKIIEWFKEYTETYTKILNNLNKYFEEDSTDDDLKEIVSSIKRRGEDCLDIVSRTTNQDLKGFAHEVLSGYGKNVKKFQIDSHFIQDCKRFEVDLNKVIKSINGTIQTVNTKQPDGSKLTYLKEYLKISTKILSIFSKTLGGYISFMGNINKLYTQLDTILTSK